METAAAEVVGCPPQASHLAVVVETEENHKKSIATVF